MRQAGGKQLHRQEDLQISSMIKMKTMDRMSLLIFSRMYVYGSSVPHTHMMCMLFLPDSIILLHVLTTTSTPQLTLASAVRILYKARAFELAPKNDAFTCSQLSTLTSASASLLLRCLRVTASHSIFAQLAPATFIHTKKSHHIAKHAFGWGYGTLHDMFAQAVFKLPTYLEQFGFEEPRDYKMSPVAFDQGRLGSSFWEIVSSDERTREAFVKGLQKMANTLPVTGIYDFGGLVAGKEGNGGDERPVLVDVGGGSGYAVKEICERYPEIKRTKVVLQDLPDVIEMSLDVPGVVKMGHNFHEEQPIKGMSISILHALQVSLLTHTQVLQHIISVDVFTITRTRSARLFFGISSMRWLMTHVY